MDLITDVQAMRAEFAAHVNANNAIINLVGANKRSDAIFPVSGDMIAAIRRGDKIDTATRLSVASTYC